MSTLNFPIIAIIAVIFIVSYIFMWTFIRPVKWIFKIFLNSLTGAVFLLIFNYIGSFFDFYIGLNIYSAFICGILGIPGFILLVILKLLGIYL